MFFLLEKDYCTALDFPELYECVGGDATVVVFNGEGDENSFENVPSLSARTEEAKEFGVIVVEFKRKLIKNFAEQVIAGESAEGSAAIRDCCTFKCQRSLGSYSS